MIVSFARRAARAAVRARAASILPRRTSISRSSAWSSRLPGRGEPRFLLRVAEQRRGGFEIGAGDESVPEQFLRPPVVLARLPEVVLRPSPLRADPDGRLPPLRLRLEKGVPRLALLGERRLGLPRQLRVDDPGEDLPSAHRGAFPDEHLRHLSARFGGEDRLEERFHGSRRDGRGDLLDAPEPDPEDVHRDPAGDPVISDPPTHDDDRRRGEEESSPLQREEGAAPRRAGAGFDGRRSVGIGSSRYGDSVARRPAEATDGAP